MDFPTSADQQHTSLSDHRDPVSELSPAFPKGKGARSPPLAFEPTPNDALSPPTFRSSSNAHTTLGAMNMGRLSPPPLAGEGYELQRVVDQQVSAIDLLHDAFNGERLAWKSEREALYTRIAKLERLLRVGDGHSPAKSPVLSPQQGTGSLTSPQARAVANAHRLPSIAEDENLEPLSHRREDASRATDMPAITPSTDKRSSSVGFAEAAPDAVKVEEIPRSPMQTAKALSPPPLSYRVEAGHTPLKTTRPPTPPPQNSMSMDGIEDTPTRNNTHINTFLTRSNDEDSEKELKGPLNMPELPHVPGDSNFTFDALASRLQQLEKHPEAAKPIVFAQPSPGLASPVERDSYLSPKSSDP